METADEVEQLAKECAIIRQAVALAGWVGPEGKALTRVGVLRKPAVPAACAAIGIRVPERFRSAADVPGLHRPWTAALALSDPLFDLEETAEEEAVRLRDAFPASARKPVRYEYDIGAGWVHEVTRTSSSRVAPGEAVSRCLSFSGDNPVEYWNEDELANPAPFDMAKVNAALAE